MSFYQLFVTNFKILYRNWRSLFWNILLPLCIYVGLSIFDLSKVVGSPIRYTEYLLPGILAWTIMQTGIFSLAYWLIEIKERGVLKRFQVTPLSSYELVGSLILTRIVLMLIQITIIAFVGLFFFHAKLNGSIVGILILLALGGSIFLSIGFIISNFAHSYDEAAPIATAVNALFTAFGNVFYSTSVLPKSFRTFAEHMPISYLTDGMRNNFVNHWTLKQTLPDIFALAIWLAIFFLFAVYVFSLNRE